MGWIAKVLSFVRVGRNGALVSDVKVDPGGGANTTAQHFPPLGDDAFPLTTDYAVTIPVVGTGREGAIGYLDPLNTPKAEKGEKRIYARDPSDGSVIVEIWLKNDGTADMFNTNGAVTLRPDGSSIQQSPGGSFELAANGQQTGQNGAGSYQLQTNGDFVVNGAKITAAGEMIPAGSVGMSTHTHAQANDSVGNSEQDVGIPK